MIVVFGAVQWYGVDWAKTGRAKCIFSEKEYSKIKIAENVLAKVNDSEKLAMKEKSAKTEIDREPAASEITESP